MLYKKTLYLIENEARNYIRIFNIRNLTDNINTISRDKGRSPCHV